MTYLLNGNSWNTCINIYINNILDWKFWTNWKKCFSQYKDTNQDIKSYIIYLFLNYIKYF